MYFLRLYKCLFFAHSEKWGVFAYNKTLGDPNDGKPHSKALIWMNKDGTNRSKKGFYHNKYTGIQRMVRWMVRLTL